MAVRISWHLPAAFVAWLLLASAVVADPGPPDAVIEGAVTELTSRP